MYNDTTMTADEALQHALSSEPVDPGKDRQAMLALAEALDELRVLHSCTQQTLKLREDQIKWRQTVEHAKRLLLGCAVHDLERELAKHKLPESALAALARFSEEF